MHGNEATVHCLISPCSGADVYAEDKMLCSPVLIAAAFSRVNAFRHLLSFMDLNNAEKNPIFKALHVKMYRADILNVSLPTRTYIFCMFIVHV